jgi:carbon storage regulator CsrA
MLIISRKPGEEITFSIAGQTVTLCVNEITGKRVRLAIDAPQDVRVRRAEIGPDEGQRIRKPN